MRIPGGRYGLGGKGERASEGASFAHALAVMDELAAARGSHDHHVIGPR
jgi:hypothetical protein